MQFPMIRDVITGLDGSGPLHRMLGDRLAELIRDGTLAPGERLPSEREVTDISGLSRVTVRKALRGLADRGLIRQRQGSGTYVSAPDSDDWHAKMPVMSLTEELRRKGQASRTIWLKRQIAQASFRDMTVLALSEPGRVAQLERIRLVDERPLSVERSVFRTDALPEVAGLDQSVYAALRVHGTLPIRIVQTVTAINMSPKDADRLHALPASAALKLTRTGYDSHGSVIEFTEGVFRPDAYRIMMEFGG